MKNPANAVQLLQELVRIPSVNPAGDPGTSGVGEARIAEELRVLLSGWGADAELRMVEPGRPNVVARFPSDRPGKPRILFAPHTDTVSVSGMTVDPFGGELRDGRIWGRGASDTKGPMAAMLWALFEERSRLASLPWEIWFAGLAGEEAGQPGAKALAGEERFDFVIAGEPTGLDVVHTHKGALWLSLVTRGVAVHAASPELGVNAIYKMADVLACIRDDLGPALSRFVDPVLGPVTVSAGVIQGGSKTNIVPDFCRAEIDIRTVPSPVDFAAFAEERLRRACPDLELQALQSLPMATDPGHPLVQALVRTGARPVGAPWFCDAAVFAARGVPSVALGPGSIAQAHTRDEWISEADLKDGVDFFRRFLCQI